jgi:tetratricopeptide (TPR) repeat protein
VHAGEVIAERFEIESLAGSGGMADVYRARDRTNDNTVALKILRATGPEDLARLAREAQALSRLTHPGIVRYVAHGTSGGSEPFVVMEWVEGVTLSKKLRSGPLPLQSAVVLGRALAAALGHAHEHGVVHRDVKPGNVVLRGDDVEDPILLDFGVARTGLAIGLTQVGTVIGTPRYMSPEQARGGQSIDARADVFALGALIFKCITGRAPFDGEDAIAVLAHLLFDDAPDVCAFVPGVPRSVGDVLLKMLAKEPALRYPDCGAVMRALDALDTSEIPVSIAAPAPSGLTLRERRLLSLMVLTGKVDADVARAVANDFGGRAEALANGSVVVIVSGRENATELARVSARCALELRHALPDAPIVLATGRGGDVDEERTETVSGDSTGSSRYSGVFERAAGLLRHDHKEILGPLPIVIDDTTAGLLGADFDIARGAGASPHALRGRTIRAQYTLLGKATPFVGRARELSSLLATWADVCEQGVARAVIVTGEAGLGKSRLLYEMLAGISPPQGGATMTLHEQPAMVLRAKADATTAGSPFAALGAAIRREVGIGDEDPPTERWNKLAARVASVVAEGQTHVAEFVAEVAGLKRTDPGEQVAAARRDPRLMGDRIRRSWQAWLRGEVARGPVLIVLEDFQWGDLPTVKLVEDMLIDLAEESVFVLALARPEIDTVFPNLWSRAVVRMPLVGLARKAATTFVRTMLPDAAPETIERIVKQASGNTLYLEELVRAAAEGKTDAPESLLAILSSQVESLPDAERRVLRAAAVFGTTFWTDGVCVLLGGAQELNDRVRADTNAVLDALARREMVGNRESRLAGQRELDFRNALIRDVTYAMLTETDAALGHALAADWLERAGETDPFVLAEHRARAGQKEQAVVQYKRSAEAALDASDFGMVLERVKRAEACGAKGEELAAMLVMAAAAHRWQGATRECGEAAARAVELATRDSALYFRAFRLHAYASSFAGDVEAVMRAAEVLQTARPADDALVDWAAALTTVANSLLTTGHFEENRRLVALTANIPPERLATDVELADLLRRAQGMRAYGCGDFVTMRDVLAKSAAIRLEVGDLREYIIQISNVGFATMWLGRLEESADAFERAREKGAELKLVTLELNAIQNGAFVQLCLGDAEAALEGSRTVLARAKIEAPRSMSLAHACSARALLKLGRLEEAESEARAAVAGAPTGVVRVYVTAVLADVLLGAKRIDEARATSNEALALLRTFATHVVGDVYTFVVRAEVLEADGDPEGAREMIVEGRALFDSRRALLKDEAARATFDARSPDGARLLAAHARLAD